MTSLPQPFAKAAVGRHRLSRETLSQHQRNRILVAATEVFAKRGFSTSTVDNIVAAAKVGVGSFYAHFDGKEDCLLAAYEQIVTAAREQIFGAMSAEDSWTGKALAALHELLTIIAAEPMQARLALVEIQTGGPAALRRYDETLEFAIASLRRGRETSASSPKPPDTLEEATVAGLAWLLARRVSRGEVRDVEGLFREMGEVALEPYLGSGKARREIAAFQKSLAAA